MMTVRLYTSDGGFVTEGLIPPFNEWPKVILWGSRVFTLFREVTDTSGVPLATPTMFAEYREAFAVYLVDATVSGTKGMPLADSAG